MAATGQTLQSSSSMISSPSSQSTQPHLQLLPRVQPLMDIKKLYQIIWKSKSCRSTAQNPTKLLRNTNYHIERISEVKEDEYYSTVSPLRQWEKDEIVKYSSHTQKDFKRYVLRSELEPSYIHSIKMESTLALHHDDFHLPEDQ